MPEENGAWPVPALRVLQMMGAAIEVESEEGKEPYCHRFL